jgi:hypothetical protein
MESPSEMAHGMPHQKSCPNRHPADLKLRYDGDRRPNGCGNERGHNARRNGCR